MDQDPDAHLLLPMFPFSAIPWNVRLMLSGKRVISERNLGSITFFYRPVTKIQRNQRLL